MKSLLSAPWAIVNRGGAAPGTRRPVRIALLVEKHADGSYRGFLKSLKLGARPTKSMRVIASNTILARFDNEPPARIARKVAQQQVVQP